MISSQRHAVIARRGLLYRFNISIVAGHPQGGLIDLEYRGPTILRTR